MRIFLSALLWLGLGLGVTEIVVEIMSRGKSGTGDPAADYTPPSPRRLDRGPEYNVKPGRPGSAADIALHDR